MFGIKDALVALVAAAATAGLMYLTVVPWERAQARKGYVVIAQLNAAEARLGELTRQVEAGNLVVSAYQTQLKNIRAKEAIDDVRIEHERKDYEAKLAAAGKSCPLDASDLEWLSK